MNSTAKHGTSLYGRRTRRSTRQSHSYRDAMSMRRCKLSPADLHAAHALKVVCTVFATSLARAISKTYNFPTGRPGSPTDGVTPRQFNPLPTLNPITDTHCSAILRHFGSTDPEPDWPTEVGPP